MPFSSPGDLPNTGIKPSSPTLQADALGLSHKGSKKRRGIENVFEEIMAAIFPNLKKETYIHVKKCAEFQTK